jgi:DNA-binding HxlR family transcriptional regulator
VARTAAARQKQEARQERSPRDAAAAVARQLDGLIHDRMRLGILTALAANDALSFIELRQALQTSDGNLSVHARKLEEAGYLSCAKSFRGRVPHSEYRLTAAGRRAFEKYLDHMEALVRAARSGS